ncbi:MAG: hypothetical protein KatS3mg061_1790 [Dehalococcoidia bacterium]|nr:MAG: hypothetical protein KatS3mg061_1790 [Dehalococcoidia bacterium]
MEQGDQQLAGAIAHPEGADLDRAVVATEDLLPELEVGQKAMVRVEVGAVGAQGGNGEADPGLWRDDAVDSSST